MIFSVSDNVVVIGIIAIGVFFGVTFVYSELNINVESDSIVFDILLLIYYVGWTLLLSGMIYKIVKWRSSRKD